MTKHHPHSRAERLALKEHEKENKSTDRKGRVRKKLIKEHIKEEEIDNELRTLSETVI